MRKSERAYGKVYGLAAPANLPANLVGGGILPAFGGKLYSGARQFHFLAGLPGICCGQRVCLIAFAGRRRLDSNLFLIIAFGLAYALQLVLTLHLRNETTALEPFEYWG